MPSTSTINAEEKLDRYAAMQINGYLGAEDDLHVMDWEKASKIGWNS
jgi:hypothetical protein